MKSTGRHLVRSPAYWSAWRNARSALTGNPSAERAVLVIATQNPLEQQGTFPLPEARLDRFLFKLNMGYPSSEESVNILKRFKDDQPLESLMAIATSERIVQARHIVSKVHVSDVILSYIVALSEHSRRDEAVASGVSRAQALLKAVQVQAVLKGRSLLPLMM